LPKDAGGVKFVDFNPKADFILTGDCLISDTHKAVFIDSHHMLFTSRGEVGLNDCVEVIQKRNHTLIGVKGYSNSNLFDLDIDKRIKLRFNALNKRSFFSFGKPFQRDDEEKKT